MIVVAIVLSIVIPSATLNTENGVSLTPVEKQMKVKDYVSAPVDSLVGIDDGTTIKASNSGTSNGTIGLVLLVLAIGAFVSVCTRVGVFDQLIEAIIGSNLSIGKITTLLSLYFVACATTFGLYESAVCYIPLLINLYKRFNVKPVYAIKVLILSVSIGYIASPINPFATMIVDQIAGNTADLFMFRTITLLILTIVLNIFLQLDLRRYPINHQQQPESLSNDRFKVLNFILFLLPYIYMTIGFMPNVLFGATMTSVTVLFVMTAIVIGLVNKLTVPECIDEIFGGVNNFMVIAVSITLARTIYIILYNAQVIDTMIYKIVEVISPFNPILILIAIAILYLVVGYVILSPSALAMITLPIIAPALELVGISVASTVTLFLFIHGLSKMYSIASPLVIASINEAEVEYQSYINSIKRFSALTLGFGLILVIIIA